MPAAPADKVYEAWVIAPGGKPLRAGLFRGGEETTTVPLDRRVPRGSVVAATVEPTGGVDAPTRPPFMTART